MYVILFVLKLFVKRLRNAHRTEIILLFGELAACSQYFDDYNGVLRYI